VFLKFFIRPIFFNTVFFKFSSALVRLIIFKISVNIFKVIPQNYSKIANIRRGFLMYFENKLKTKKDKNQLPNMGCHIFIQFFKKRYCSAGQNQLKH
jgi:hypothetical protein